MSEDNQEKDILTLVEEAQSTSRFNLADVIKGRGYPEDTVEVYLDIATAYELSKLNDLLIVETDEKLVAELEAKAEELSETIKKSRLKFKMRGIDQRQVEALEAKAQEKYKSENEDWVIEYMCELVAANIVSVENADGSIDERLFVGEDAQQLRGSLPPESWEAIVSTMQKLTLATGYFKGLTDAGFLQKS